MKFVLGMLLVLTFCFTASADSVWTYTGNSVSGSSNVGMPNPCSCAITATVTLDAAGDATSWDFTDGTHTLTQANSTGSIQSSLSAGAPFFSTWEVSLQTASVSLFSSFVGSAFEATDSVLVGNSLFMFEQGNRGTWTQTVATPEPGAGLLFACGLLATCLAAVTMGRTVVGEEMLRHT